MPMRLADYQKDFIRELYREDISRGYLSIPRGNAKTTTMAALALAELFLLPHMPMVNLYTPFIDQGNADDGIWGMCSAMVEAAEGLADLTKVSMNNSKPGIFTKHNRGTCKMVPIRSHGRLVGGGPTLAICDEVSQDEWSLEKINHIRQGQGKRPGSKMVLISTPGPDGNPFVTMRDVIRRKGLPEGVSWTEYSADEADDPSLESTWRKANPALDAGYLELEKVRQEWLDDTMPLWQFQKYRLGMHNINDARDGWLGLEGIQKWDENIGEVIFDDEGDIILAADLSTYWDCSAVVMIQKQGEQWVSRAFIFYPDMINGVYRIDRKAVLDLIYQLFETHDNIKCLAFDPNHFITDALTLQSDGYPVVEIPQDARYMGPAYSHLYNLIYTGRFIHEDDPDYRDHVISAIAKPHNDNMDIMLSKRKTREKKQKKIDAVVATAIAIAASGDAARPDIRVFTFDDL